MKFIPFLYIILYGILSWSVQSMQSAVTLSEGAGKSKKGDKSLVKIQTKRSMLEDDPCLDAKQIEDATAIEFSPRYAHLNKPWMRSDPRPKVYSSNGLRYQWTWAKSLAVRGLNPVTTIDDLLRFFDSHNCSFLAVGQAVWQSVLRIKPVRISGEVSCSLEKLYSACLLKFGNSACGLYPLDNGGWAAYRLEIGDARANSSIDELRAEPLSLFFWGHTLGQHPHNWTYTVSTMAIYDNQAGQIYLLDMTGRGYSDTCEKKISAAVEENQWDTWAEGDVIKILSFYQLRSEGFSTSNTGLQEFINNILKEKNNKKAVQSFYCEFTLGGVVSWAGEGLTTACHLVYPDTFTRKKITAAKEVMAHELGAQWKNGIESAIEDMEAVYLTDQQFVDVRNRLKNRISASLVTQKVTVLRLGEPLVNDISEVHRRPILSKTEDVKELPRDFPTAGGALPDENLEFKSQELPTGAGYNDPFTYEQKETSSDENEYRLQGDYDNYAEVPISKDYSPTPMESDTAFTSNSCLAVISILLYFMLF